MPTRASVVALFSSPYSAPFLVIGMRNISTRGALAHKILSECSAGGVRLISGNERITIDNTLDERLRLLEEQVRYRHSCSIFKNVAYLKFLIHRCYPRSALTYSGLTRIASFILEFHVCMNDNWFYTNTFHMSAQGRLHCLCMNGTEPRRRWDRRTPQYC